ncbi:MAG: 4-hydroxythreonine-4-phosphate dehydrogenase PdxA [Candidatus Edwardsbacteria bacterium RIFOXYD12_FULL_50_11]|uniref:4-hydroxythreonine-4-phosphate dehydrogenase PdxA n=1 Tax=Candidatus Edwardsbacteria bacterium GWF2_54_11 TaxID=1817851 RepID=A0A1F5RGG4_9BACT|nr:MAG: 4-hydroxythreonine-4-phosphate dehydrogenase PdxA [Candidatus Edwardsbacteria bacterium RifOxyC12_full_54_24]OGF07231.1 MAG: 4-hydroxythreonine-4-phosphate dehydrogenase PdxA [Candidatus Edwardsbacteria bacterium RifOxyA12_full_54_48]OGF09486.1 MAG: 4-hydroxythreonine-4-phosphate dehydrogenase PdxA [Candidatus Edwardsbacteria bacterium GWE2_54_12]OGF13414.1 MAG: 4-hydroxythreonine-4-phosphate dehydrogenase PdxA [Candidatus Edwardsbacteria bacterium GWF2_54_11]OGF17249.1 MAG: 4-hydroxyth
MSMKPRIAITMGDPSGIGPEVALKAALDSRVRRACQPVLVGPRDLWQEFAGVFGLKLTDVPVHDIYCPRFNIGPGRESAQTGRMAAESIISAAVMALDNAVSGMATAPISKKALSLAGYEQTAHTELLAQLCGSGPCAMMFAAGKLRVTLATIHQPLARVPGLITRQLIMDKLSLTDAALKKMWGIKRPRIAVLGLNPHAGEQGLLGREEMAVISPAVARAAKAGIDAAGPVSAEAGFRWCQEGKVDALLAMYHDQGLLPLKVLGGATNITLGLPFIRTSPDHGTAGDIAWKNQADPEPMVKAVLLAARLAGRTKR